MAGGPVSKSMLSPLLRVVVIWQRNQIFLDAKSGHILQMREMLFSSPFPLFSFLPCGEGPAKGNR